MSDFIDELMDFNPQDVTAFQEPTQQAAGNPNIYKTNPNKVSKEVASDGHYRSKIRIIYNPFDKAQSIVEHAHYSFTDMDGFFMLDSKLAMGDKSCRMFRDWKALHFNQDPEIVATVNVDGLKTPMTRRQWGDYMFEKSELRYCLIQVIEDENQPELVGKFMAMKLPKAIFDTLMAKMNPTDKAKTPQDLMNYLFGPILSMDVTPGPDDPQNPERKQREIKYNLCEFESDPTPIITVTGESLFTDEEVDMINDYADGKKVLTNPKATAKKKEEAKKKCTELVPALKKLMQKALDYAKENAINLMDEVGYHEPSEERWARYERWIKLVNEFKDPATVTESNTISTTTSTTITPTEEMPNEEDDLPF